MVLSLLVTLRLSLFLSTEALIISQNSLRQTLSTSLSQAPPFTAVGLTHPQRHRHQSSMSPTHQLSQAADQPQAHTTICLRPTSPIASDPLLFRSLSLFVFSSNRVPHYPTYLKSEHYVSLCTHHHCLWSLIDDRRRSRRLIPNRTEYQAWVSIWLCWFFWVFVLFFFTSFDRHGGIMVMQWFLWIWWWLWWCVDGWMKYYFIVVFILFYCVKS